MKETAENLWKFREQNRIRNGDYKEVNALLIGRGTLRNALHSAPNELNHFLHVSEEDSKMVAYTPSDEYGIQGRKIRVKLGRYLHKFYSSLLSEDEIRDFAAAYREATIGGGILLARKADDIEWIYENGPDSCMRGKDWKSHCSQHPCRLYSMSLDDEVAVAYMYRDGRITARSVVNTKTKIWTRIYGDEIALSSKLRNAGYTSGTLDGTRFPVIPLEHKSSGAFLMPYIDNSNQRFSVENGVITISRNGDAQCKSTVGEGILPNDAVCSNCSTGTQADDLVEISEDEHICDECLDNYYVNAVYDETGNVHLCHSDRTVYVQQASAHYENTTDVLMHYGILWSSVEGAFILGEAGVITMSGSLIYTENAVLVHDHEEVTGFSDKRTLSSTSTFINPNPHVTENLKYYTAQNETEKSALMLREDLVSISEYVNESVRICMLTLNIDNPYLQLGYVKTIELLRANTTATTLMLKTLMEGRYYDGEADAKFISEARIKLYPVLKEARANRIPTAQTQQTVEK